MPDLFTLIARSIRNELHAQNVISAPRAIVPRINLDLTDSGENEIAIETVFQLFFSTNAYETGNDNAIITDVRVQFHVLANRFALTWPADSTDDSISIPEKYALVLSKFGFSASDAARISLILPPPSQVNPQLVGGRRSAWYTNDVKQRNNHYWTSYVTMLRSKPWIHSDAITNLNDATDKIVGQLEDPTDPTFPSRGLVVGHVQSGKTQNFAGVIAKAIDAGYRLIIVLSGSTDPLRMQTQRRLDMELVGVENILNGITKENNPGAYASIDYVSSGNPNWPNKFIRHDTENFASGSAPRIVRLTDSLHDVAALNKIQIPGVGNSFNVLENLDTTDEKIYSWQNLSKMKVRFVVVKKQKNNLEKLIDSLYENQPEEMQRAIKQLPTLVIDDESDQASLNTRKKPEPQQATDADNEETEYEKERTTINKAIVQILDRLPRAQYLAYTATPFANVLVDIEDEKDLFPRDFILPLDTPDGYMGASSFHDLEELEDHEIGDLKVSNKAAFIREFDEPENEHDGYNIESLKNAIDTFIIAGAIKLWRNKTLTTIDTTHHTMLIHDSHLKEVASDISDLITESIWPDLAYSSHAGLSRLRKVFTQDIVPVSKARPTPSFEMDASLPQSFDDLIPFIDETVHKVESGDGAVMIVNSKENKVQFDLHPTWAILVGGNLLSRGFTVEGLTVSYYSRVARTQSALMQMGRWFGYRIGYEDLVRVYLPLKSLWRKATARKEAHYINLCEFFTRTAIAEEMFREDISIYSKKSTEDGIARIRPIDIRPLVYKANPELMPVARNKMQYAELAFGGRGGVGVDLHRLAKKEDGKNRTSFEVSRTLVERAMATNKIELLGIRGKDPSVQSVHMVDATNDEVLALIRGITFSENYRIDADIELIERAVSEGGLTAWKVLVAATSNRYTKQIEGHDIALMNKTRKPTLTDVADGEFSRSNQFLRSIIEQISGRPEPLNEQILREKGAQNPILKETGAVMISYSLDRTLGEDEPAVVSLDDVATLVTYSLPYKWSPFGRVGYRVIRTGELLNEHEEHDFTVDPEDLPGLHSGEGEKGTMSSQPESGTQEEVDGRQEPDEKNE